MKQKLENLVAFILKRLSRATIFRYRPAIVGVTGTVGKTSTTLAIAAVLSTTQTVRTPHQNFNGEIGLALTILGNWREEDLLLFSRHYKPGEHRLRKIWFLLKVILTSAYHLVLAAPYPQVLVLEYGIDKPGDMRKLVRIARPNVGVLTAVGETPAHVEFFKDPLQVAREKAKLIEAVPSSGAIVLNGDDPTVTMLARRTHAEILTFGFESEAMVGIENFEHRVENGAARGISFKLRRNGTVVPVRLNGVLGKSHAYAAAAAASVGLIFGLNLVSICEGLEKNYRPAPHRMQLLAGIRGSAVIDDSYNASPLSMRAALEALQDLPAKRRIAVLGDMLEIGEYAMEAHEKIGGFAAHAADELFLIGAHAKLIADGAEKKGFNKKDVHLFEDAEAARETLQNFVKAGDLVLVKASHAVGLELLATALTATPAESKPLSSSPV